MLKSELEKLYLVKVGRGKCLIEVRKTSTGKTFIVVHKDITVKYVEGDEVKEWSHDISKAEEVDFKALPESIRGVISLNMRSI